MAPIKKGEPSVTVSFEIPESMLKWLREQSSKQDRSMSWLIRLALSQLKGRMK